MVWPSLSQVWTIFCYHACKKKEMCRAGIVLRCVFIFGFNWWSWEWFCIGENQMPCQKIGQNRWVHGSTRSWFKCCQLRRKLHLGSHCLDMQPQLPWEILGRFERGLSCCGTRSTNDKGLLVNLIFVVLALKWLLIPNPRLSLETARRLLCRTEWWKKK